jgi:osmotically-inducible protein OsmY
MKNTLALTGFIATSLIGIQAHALEGTTKDAWIDGKLEAVYLLNRHLNSFAIDTSVADGIVHLTGRVPTGIDRDLAGELAKGIEGVVDVNNDLQIAAASAAAPPAKASSERSFGAWVDDATTTASVKTKLLADKNTGGLKIHVETRGDVVTLTGEVASAEEKSLAEQLARNTGDVGNVHNELIVKKN